MDDFSTSSPGAAIVTLSAVVSKLAICDAGGLVDGNFTATTRHNFCKRRQRRSNSLQPNNLASQMIRGERRRASTLSPKKGDTFLAQPGQVWSVENSKGPSDLPTRHLR